MMRRWRIPAAGHPQGLKTAIRRLVTDDNKRADEETLCCAMFNGV